MNNYEAIYKDHLDRIASEKGEGYANSIKGATTVLVGGDLIIETVQLEKTSLNGPLHDSYNII